MWYRDAFLLSDTDWNHGTIVDLRESRVRLTRAESRRRTRVHLLEAAAEVFARRGFHGASVEEVAEVAGYTKGAVYSNFTSKDDLFLAVLEGRIQPQVDLLDRRSARAPAPPAHRPPPPPPPPCP